MSIRVFSTLSWFFFFYNAAARPRTAAPNTPMAGRASLSTPLPEVELEPVALAPALEVAEPTAAVALDKALPAAPVAEPAADPAALVAAPISEPAADRAEE